MVKRPKAVWMILIWYLFSNFWTLLIFTLIIYGYIPTRSDHANVLTPIYYISVALVSLFEISGAITLFMLRKKSVYLLLAGFLISVSVTIFQIINNAVQTMAGGVGFDLGVIVGYAVSFVICVYSLSLKNRGSLY